MNTAESRDQAWQLGAWLQFSAVVLISTGSFFWVRHYSHVFDSLVQAHLGDSTFMVPLVDPLRWRMKLGEVVSSASAFYAASLRHRGPRPAALGVLLFSMVALLATIIVAP